MRQHVRDQLLVAPTILSASVLREVPQAGLW